MTIAEALKTHFDVVTLRTAGNVDDSLTQLGRIVDQMRFKHGATYAAIQRAAEIHAGVTPQKFEAVMALIDDMESGE
jgi:hypothetical protein